MATEEYSSDASPTQIALKEESDTELEAPRPTQAKGKTAIQDDLVQSDDERYISMLF